MYDKTLHKLFLGPVLRMKVIWYNVRLLQDIEINLSDMQCQT